MSSPTSPSDQEPVFLSPPYLTGRESELIEEALASNYVAPAGPMIDRFENDLSKCTGFTNVTALSSGTAAIHLALRLAGVAAGDTVWSSTLTFIGGVSPILYLGAQPIFFDVNKYGLFDLDLMEEKLSSANQQNQLPKAIIVTDLYGIPCDIERCRELCDRYGITLVSDAAESLGSLINKRQSGYAAHFAAFSFNGNKIVTTSGGGALAANDPNIMSEALKLATQAREPAAHYEHHTYGYNYRLSNISAAIGVAQLENLDHRVSRKRQIARLYQKLFDAYEQLTLLPEPDASRSNRWLSVFFVDPEKTRTLPTEIIQALAANNIESRPVWKPMHMQKLFQESEYIGGQISEMMFKQGLCLPSGVGASDESITRTAKIVSEQFKPV